MKRQMKRRLRLLNGLLAAIMLICCTATSFAVPTHGPNADSTGSNPTDDSASSVSTSAQEISAEIEACDPESFRTNSTLNNSDSTIPEDSGIWECLQIPTRQEELNDEATNPIYRTQLADFDKAGVLWGYWGGYTAAEKRKWQWNLSTQTLTFFILDHAPVGTKVDDRLWRSEGNETIKILIVQEGWTGDFGVPDGIEEVYLPSTLDTHHNFSECRNLRKAVVANGARKLYASFDGCTNLSSVTLPNSLEEIGNRAFSNCSSLETIILPSGLKQIGSAESRPGDPSGSSFRRCTSLKEIVIPENVSLIAQYSFEGCTQLRSVELPRELTEIAERTFSNCVNLKSIRFPESLKIIQKCAFLNCQNLHLSSLPLSLEEIGASAFMCCNAIQELTVPSSVRNLGFSFVTSENLRELTIASRGLEEYKLLGAYCALGRLSSTDNPNLTLITISGKLKTLRRSDFFGLTSLESLVITGTVDEMDDSIFAGLSKLKEVVLPTTVQRIPERAFSQCDQLSTLSIPDSVTAIGKEAFNGCTSLIKLRIPSSVTSIGSSVFKNCTNLKHLTGFGGVNQLKSVVWDIRNSLASIYLDPGIQTIEAGAFRGCTSLSTVELPDTIREIGRNAFADCQQIQTIRLPDNVTEIGEGAFSGCTMLESVQLPGTLLTVRAYSFSNTGLKKAIISEGVEQIDGHAFYSCNNLRVIYIPATINKMGGAMFSENLADVFFGGTQEQWQALHFNAYDKDILQRATIHFNSSPLEIGGMPAASPTPSSAVMPSGHVTKSVMRLKSHAPETNYVCFYTSLQEDSSRFSYVKYLDQTSNIPASLSNLVDTYVYVESRNVVETGAYKDYITLIEPITPAVGAITGVGNGRITVDGTTFKTDMADLNALTGQTVMYFIRNGIFMDTYIPAQKVTGKLSIKNGNKPPVKLAIDEVQCSIGDYSGPQMAAEVQRLAGLLVSGTVLDGQLLEISAADFVDISVTYEMEQEKRGAVQLYGQSVKANSPGPYILKTSDSSVVAFSGSRNAETIKVYGSAPFAFSESVTLYAGHSGSAVISCCLSDGTVLKQLSVSVTDPAIKALKQELSAFDKAWNDYIVATKIQINRKAMQTAEEGSMKALAKELTTKLKKDYGLELGECSTDEVRVAICTAMLEMLQQEIIPYYKNGKIEKPEDAAKVMIGKLKHMWYTYNDGAGTTVTLSGMPAAGTGVASYHKGSRSYENVTITTDWENICNFTEDFMNQLMEMGQKYKTEAYKTCVTELSKALFGKSLKELTTGAVTELFSKYAPELAGLDIPDFTSTVKAAVGFAELTQNVLDGNFPDAQGLANKVSAIKFETISLGKGAAKAAIYAMEEAKKKVAELLKSIGGSSVESGKKSWLQHVYQCPVDVEIYDTHGTQIGFVGESSEPWADNGIEVSIFGDNKIVRSYGEPVTFKIQGTDYGTFSYIVEEIKDDTEVARIMYYDLPLSPESVYTVQTNDQSTSDLIVRNENSIQRPDASVSGDSYDTSWCLVTTSMSGKGTIAGAGMYLGGDSAILLATPEEGYNFQYWADDTGRLLSMDRVFQFTVSADCRLKAVFVENDTDGENVGQVKPLPSPTVSPTNTVKPTASTDPIPTRPVQPTDSSEPSMSPKPNVNTSPVLPQMNGYQAGLINKKTYYVKTSGFSTMYYLKSSSGRIARVSAPYVVGGDNTRYYPMNHAGTVLFPRLENGTVTCFCIFKDGMEIPVLATAAKVNPQKDEEGYQTGMVNGKTYYVKTSGASTMFYLKSSSGRMARVSAPYVTDADGIRYYPVNYRGAVLFPKQSNGRMTSYTTGSGEEILTVI